jgi:hypothetical protein
MVTSRSGPVKIPPMVRKLRMEYPGAIYHVMNRGDRREDIFVTGVKGRLGHLK